MRTDFMPSAKQIAWRKKFARMSKAGVFRKKSKVRKPDGSRQSDFIPQYEFDEARRKKEGKPSIFAKSKKKPNGNAILTRKKMRRSN